MKKKKLPTIFGLILFLFFIMEIKGNNNLPKWDSKIKIVEDPTESGATLINSFSANSETGNKIYLGKKDNKSYLFYNKKEYDISSLSEEMTYIESPLIEYTKDLYFCSSSQYLIKFNSDNDEIIEIETPELLEGKWESKCFYIDKEKVIIVAFLGTQYVFSYDLEEKKWRKNDPNNPYNLDELILEGKILDANIKENKQSNELLLNTICQNNLGYFINQHKYDNKNFHQILSIDFSDQGQYSDLKFYSKALVSLIDLQNIVIFTYEQEVEKFIYYHFDLGRRSFDYFGIQNYLPIFKDSIINKVNFIENTPILYYSIKNLIDGNYYIGVVDLQYSLLLYNMKIEDNYSLFFNEGYIDKNQAFLIYFKNSSQTLICPFVSESDYCIFRSQSNDYFTIQNINNINQNSFDKYCSSGYVFGNYCNEKCPVLYRNSHSNLCDRCYDFYNFGTKTCFYECPDFPKEYNVCFDCKNAKKKFYNFDCINNCEDIYGENDPNDENNCINCKKDKNESFDTFTKKCIKECPPRSEINNYTGECKQCILLGLFFYKYRSICVEKCPDFYISDNQNECILCPDNTIFFDGECVNSCQVGYEKRIIDIDEVQTQICEKCFDKGKYYLNYTCIEKCPSHYIYDDKKFCFLCNENSETNIFFQDGECVEKCKEGYEPIINESDYYCDSCLIKNKFFNHNKKCAEKCEEFSLFTEDNICYFCNETENRLKQGEKCVEKCDRGYGTNITFGLCNFCRDNDTFYLDGWCQEKCGDWLGWDEKDNICVNCKEEFNYYFQNYRCVENCAPHTKKDFINQICIFCDNYFFDSDCVDDCPKFTVKNEESKYCYYCPDNQKFSEGKCVHKCSGNYIENIYEGKAVCEQCGLDEKSWFSAGICTKNCSEYKAYASTDHYCHFCYCPNHGDTCFDFNNQCNCKNTDHNFGRNCELFSEESLSEKSLSIILLSISAIRSNKTIFTYKIKEDLNFLIDESFLIEWGFSKKGKELTKEEKYKNYFTTGCNEDIFGINNGLLEGEGDQDNVISLSIKNQNGSIFLKDKVSIKIEPFSISPQIWVKSKESLDHFPVESADITFTYENTNQMKYYYQISILDERNENIPLTKYQPKFDDETQIYLKLPNSTVLYVNIKTDRNEILTTDKNLGKFYFRDSYSDYEKILCENITNVEKIFKIIAYFKSNDYNIEINDKIYDLLFNSFIKERFKEVINEQGFYEEETIISDDPKIISLTYLEPKTIFSLINYIIPLDKKKINNSMIQKIFHSLNETFLFIDNLKNNSISLSQSDSLSLFRTIDCLLNLFWGKDKTIEELYIFKKTLDDIFIRFGQYLSFKTYPGEMIRIRGISISFYMIHFGYYQKELFLSSTNGNKNFNKSNPLNFSTYKYENYNFNEDQCRNDNNISFCISKSNLLDFRNKLIEKGIEISQLSLNFYLIKDLGGSEGLSANFKLFNTKKKEYIQVENMSLFYDIEIPFDIQTSKNNFKIINNENKDIKNENFDEIKSYLFEDEDIFVKPKNYSIYSNVVCIPKNNLYNENKYCFTHFNYINRTIKCSCNVLDEIIYVEDKKLANYYKNLQFPKNIYEYSNSFTLNYLLIFLVLLLVPNVFYLLYDIYKDNLNIKLINLTEPEEKRKKAYNETKHYSNTSLLGFTFFITLYKFPFFFPFRLYKYQSPKFMKHFIVILGIFFGFSVALAPFYFYMPFLEKTIIINKRDIYIDDNKIYNFEIIFYYFIRSILFAIIGTLFTNFFIFVFCHLLKFDKIELEYWNKVKLLFSKFIYNELKRDVLLGQSWRKIKLRMITYFHICGLYVLRQNIKNNPDRNKKFENYLLNKNKVKYIEKINQQILREDNQLFPFGDEDSLPLDTSQEIIPIERITEHRSQIRKYFPTEQNKLNESTNTLGDVEERKNNENIFNEINLRLDSNTLSNSNSNANIEIKSTSNNNELNTSKNIKNIPSIAGNYNNPKKGKEFSSFKLQETVADRFKINDNRFSSSSNNADERFDYIKNKYIYVNNKSKYIIETEIESESVSSIGIEQNHLITHVINYSFFSTRKFNSVEYIRISSKISIQIAMLVLVSIILFFLYMSNSIFITITIKKFLDEFEKKMLTAWMLITTIIITIGNFIFYFIKSFIGSILLFNFYHLRKRKCYLKLLFWIFVNKNMRNIFKIRNFVTKYRGDFDY